MAPEAPELLGGRAKTPIPVLLLQHGLSCENQPGNSVALPRPVKLQLGLCPQDPAHWPRQSKSKLLEPKNPRPTGNPTCSSNRRIFLLPLLQFPHPQVHPVAFLALVTIIPGHLLSLLILKWRTGGPEAYSPSGKDFVLPEKQISKLVPKKKERERDQLQDQFSCS